MGGGVARADREAAASAVDRVRPRRIWARRWQIWTPEHGSGRRRPYDSGRWAESGGSPQQWWPTEARVEPMRWRRQRLAWQCQGGAARDGEIRRSAREEVRPAWWRRCTAGGGWHGGGGGSRVTEGGEVEWGGNAASWPLLRGMDGICSTAAIVGGREATCCGRFGRGGTDYHRRLARERGSGRRSARRPARCVEARPVAVEAGTARGGIAGGCGDQLGARRRGRQWKAGWGNMARPAVDEASLARHERQRRRTTQRDEARLVVTEAGTVQGGAAGGCGAVYGAQRQADRGCRCNGPTCRQRLDDGGALWHQPWTRRW
uniref:Uncharacterized protein n=1 Tax=Oryza nivara TaxID=4536 RepID=A0A0E0J345_ORYNI